MSYQFSLFVVSLVWEFSLVLGSRSGSRIVSRGDEGTTSCSGCMTFSEFICCESLWRPPCGAVSHLPFPGFQLSAGSPILAPDLLYLGLKPCLPVLLVIGNESWNPTSSSTPLCICRSSASFWHLELVHHSSFWAWLHFFLSILSIFLRV